MQYPGKLMNHTCDNGKKPNFGLDFGLFGPNLGPYLFLQVLPLLVFRHFSKLSSDFQGKTNEVNLRKWQKN